MVRHQSLLITTIVLACSISSANDKEKNWPQFRGPFSNGTAVDATPPISWTPEQAKWKTDIPGLGSGSPVVWDTRVILLTAVKTDRQKDGVDANAEPAPRGGRGRGGRGGFGGPPPTHYYDFYVICIDRGNGNELWRTKVNSAVPHEAGHGTNTFASASPVTNGELIWASFNSFGLFCLDMEGNIKWKRDFGKMTTRASFGEGASPALHDDTLIMNWDHEGQSFIEAMKASTGETI